MKRKIIAQLFGSLLGLMFLLTLMTRAQNKPPKLDDPELDRVQAMISQAKKESGQFSKSGSKASEPNNPNLKWAATLWEYRNKHPDTPASAIATTEALRLLVRADRISEMQTKADTVKLDEAAWKRAIYVLVEAAANKKDYNYLISKTQALSQTAVDPEIKVFAHITLGDAYWKSGDTAQARVAFQAVVTKYPKTPYAEEAEGNLMEIELLNPGQPAPQFARTTIKGDPISLAGFKGRVVVLKFWGTY